MADSLRVAIELGQLLSTSRYQTGILEQSIELTAYIGGGPARRNSEANREKDCTDEPK